MNWTVAATVGGWVIAVLTLFGTWVSNKRKADVDESALVLGKWKELVEQHEKTLKAANSQIGSLENRVAAAEARIAELEQLRREDAAEMRSLREENAGLKRTIAQHSQSAAVLLPANKRGTNR